MPSPPPAEVVTISKNKYDAVTVGSNLYSPKRNNYKRRNRTLMTTQTGDDDDDDDSSSDSYCFCSLPFCPPLSAANNNKRNVMFANVISNQKYVDYYNVDEEDEQYPVEIVLEPPEAYKDCPRILTPQMMQKLIDDALPCALKTSRWNRIYCAGRDGDAHCTFLQRCFAYKHTIIVIQTTNGDVIGGYATEPWKRQEGADSKRTFYGTGQSFLFSNHPSLILLQQQQKQINRKASDDYESSKTTNDNNNNNCLAIYKWSGMNTYSQICDAEEGLIAMGGGGAFGLIIQDSFARGSTGYCSTFSNPPLIPNTDECFDIQDFEVWGFESITTSFFGTPTKNSNNSQSGSSPSRSASGGDVSTVSLRSLLTEDTNEETDIEPCSD